MEFLQYLVDSPSGVLGDNLEMKFTSCSNEKGDHWSEPYLKVFSESQGEQVVDEITKMGITSELDCYEDDDGEGDGGRPIILYWWSVRFPGLKITKDINLPSYLEVSNELQ